MRYYSTQRPITPGAYPKENVISIKNFHDKKYVSEIGGDAWGYVEYDCEPPEEKVRAYEFTPVNPMHCTAKQLAAMKRILSRGQKALNARACFWIELPGQWSAILRTWICNH